MSRLYSHRELKQLSNNLLTEMSLRRSPLSRPNSGFSGTEKSIEAALGDHADRLETEESSDPSTLASADSPTKAFLLFLLCLFMHVILIGIHLALVIVRFKVHGDQFKVSDQRFNDVTEVLFYYVTAYPNIIIKVCNIQMSIYDAKVLSGLPSSATVCDAKASFEEGFASEADTYCYARQVDRLAFTWSDRSYDVEVPEPL